MAGRPGRSQAVVRGFRAPEELRRQLAERRPRMSVGGLGAPGLIAIGLVALSASVYMMLGIVAGAALGLTPLVLLVSGLFFLFAVMTYVEGDSVHPERGGASTFARYAVDELWSFIAGWAILLDYLIIMALAASLVPHYLAAFWSGADQPLVAVAIAAVTIAAAAVANVRGIDARALRRALRVGIANLVLSVVVVAAGLALLLEPAAIIESIDLGRAPTFEGLLFAVVVAAAAGTGIEAASGLAGDLTLRHAQLQRVVALSAAGVLVLLVGLSLVAIAAVPVTGGATALGDRFADAPILGVAMAFEPAWLSEVLRYAVGAGGTAILVLAAGGNMLGLSRLSYSLATNRQIPSAVGKLHPQRSTPYAAIAVAAVAALVLAATGDVVFLAGVFAYGAMLAFTVAHVSVIVLRFREPTARRAFRIPMSVRMGRGSVPLPALLGAVGSAIGWVSVLLLHEGGRIVGTVWMLGGLTLYLVYRLGQGKPLRKRFTIPADALREAPELEYGSILVPVFGRPLDDDIVGTAGRLAGETDEPGEDGEAVIEALYVLEVPMSLPLDGRLPEERVARGRRALARAREVGEEYEGVRVDDALVRGRSVGQTIVDEARRRGVEAIVLAAEEPTRTRGGPVLGGRGEPRDRATGEVTRYVMEKAPCRVILTAPPAGEEEGTREGVAP
jgi:APA family basic amino acid/polyamine antiporter